LLPPDWKGKAQILGWVPSSFSHRVTAAKKHWMKDRFGREINYIRVSVTDRCNLRCVYCMPPEGVIPLEHRDILTYEEILVLLRVARSMGISHVRLTGGEPLVRKDLEELVRGIKAAGFEDISMTTNGTLLAGHAATLKEAGLMRVNVSLDSLRPERFSKITRCGRIEDALAGIEAALGAGLSPVKINVVVMKGWNFDEVADLARLTLDMPVHVRFIEYMPVGSPEGMDEVSGATSEEIREEICKKLPGGLEVSAAPPGAGPARTYRLPGSKGTVGFISAVSNPFCGFCNRLRLTADGKLRPCLASAVEIDVSDLLRHAARSRITGEIEKALRLAILSKPAVHGEWRMGSQGRRMCQIGG